MKKKQKIVLNQLIKDTRLNKVFKLVLTLSRAILDIVRTESLESSLLIYALSRK